MLNAQTLPNLTIGADPELFVRRGRHFISGHLFPCGTKDSPMPTAHGMIQNDGLALELNIRPARTQDEFVTNVSGALGDLSRRMSTTSAVRRTTTHTIATAQRRPRSRTSVRLSGPAQDISTSAGRMT
jgi:hypothetical protein